MRTYKDAVIQCATCGVTMQRRAPNHKHCDSCRKGNQLKANRAYHARPDTAEKRRLQRQEVKDRINARKRERYAETAEYRRAYQKAWSDRNREKLSMQRRARIYGLSVDDLVALLAGQGGVCPICGVELALSERFHVDHDHSTGAVRGLLHDACNKGIGMLADDPARCERAAAYLRGDYAKLRLVA